MGKTFYDIWLETSPPVSAASSSQLLRHHLPSFYSKDDSDTIRAVQKIGTRTDVESTGSIFSLNIRSMTLNVQEKMLYKQAVLTIIRDCINHLSILIGFDISKLPNQSRPVFYKNMEERFEVDFESHVIGGAYTDTHKIHKDLKEIIFVLQSLWDEVYIFSDATSLNDFVQASNAMKQEERDLLEESETKNRKYLGMLNKLKLSKTASMEDLKLVDIKTFTLRTELTDLSAYITAAIDYTRKWEGARTEQNTMTITTTENTHKSVIDGAQRKQSLERICHKNIHDFYIESTKDYLEEIEDWMRLYDLQMEDKDMDILNMKHLTSSLVESREVYEQKYEARSKEIGDWLEYKRIKKEREERFELDSSAATKIQAWWRGVMVRKKLGPYKPKKKGKKGDKKGKKNGKRKGKK